MRAVVVGGGPVGLFCAVALAREGHDVVLVDRDPGPQADGAWERRGVMQFRHPHFFRQFVRQALLSTVPDFWDALIAAGALPALMDGMPEQMTSLRCRRSTYEGVLWQLARREPRLQLRTGHADSVEVRDGRAVGVVVDGGSVDADVVISAAGRTSRFADDLRPPAEGGDCGVSYVSRMYRARPGAEALDGFPSSEMYAGYQAIVFPQDDRTLSALVVRPTAGDALGDLRHNEVFDAVAPLIPQLAPWVDPSGHEPITDVMVGGRLTNSYRGQLDDAGEVPVGGLFFIGDTVCTTNPSAGRGVSLGLLQAQELVRLLRAGGDHREVSHRFDEWCTESIRPWYDDHVEVDAAVLRWYAGEPVRSDERLSSLVICLAAEPDDPSMMSLVGPYFGMLALPSSLEPLQERVQGMVAAGWQPAFADGPTAAELADVIGKRVLPPALAAVTAGRSPGRQV